MKQTKYIRIVAFIILQLLFYNIYAQNYLPTTVNIKFSNSMSISTRNAKQESVLSTLISWERQGYFENDGDFILSSNFELNDISNKYVLKIRLECEVKELKVNGIIICNNLQKQFFNNSNKYAEFILYNDVLKKGSNTINAYCSNLGYTGGKTHKIFSLTPFKSNIKENIKIDFNESSHVFLGNKIIAIISSCANKKAKIKLHIEDIYHHTVLDSILRTPKGAISKKVNIGNICKTPGVYQITTEMKGTGYSDDVEWFTIKPQEIINTNHANESYNEYWESASKQLSQIKPIYRIHKIDSLCSKSNRDVYIVEMQSLGNVTIRGYLFMPKDKLQHRAILHLPGYGYGFENIENFMNSKTDRIDLALCVRGHGISKDVFNPGYGTPGVWGYKLYDKDSLSYKSIYMDCVRAVEFLKSRKEVYKDRIGVVGGSQGGGLALATAALCNKDIAACAYFNPFP